MRQRKKVQINSGFGQLFWLFALSSCHWKLYWIIGKIENIHLTLPVSRKKMEDKLSNVACITQKNPDGMNSFLDRHPNSDLKIPP